MGTWIDFKQLREQLDFADVLKYYGVQLKASAAGQHHGRCPLPNHPKESTSLSFSASLKKKIWRCFGCGTAGNVLDFCIRMEHGNPKNPADVRKVAVLLQERQLGGGPKFPKASPPKPSLPERHDKPPRKPSPQMSEVINPPLDFALKNLNPEHDFFRHHGLLRATIEHFGLGYCTKGMLAGRIAIPLHDSGGNLIGYGGRLTDQFDITPESPRYTWPGNRERNGVRHVFRLDNILYHSHAIEGPVTDLVIVQSVESVWWLWQAGYTDVVGIMLDTPSLEQSRLIVDLVRPKGRIWLVTDASKIGERIAGDLFFDLGPQRFCRWVKLAEGEPTDYTPEQLREMLAWNVVA